MFWCASSNMWIQEIGCIWKLCVPKDYEITGLTAIHNKFYDPLKWYIASNSFIYIGPIRSLIYSLYNTIHSMGNNNLWLIRFMLRTVRSLCSDEPENIAVEKLKSVNLPVGLRIELPSHSNKPLIFCLKKVRVVLQAGDWFLIM